MTYKVCNNCGIELDENLTFKVNGIFYCRTHYTEANNSLNDFKKQLEKDSEFDTVEHPSHYQIGNLEVIDIIRESMSREKYIGYLEGNIKKYIFRWEHKNGIEDLKKAKKYTEFLINELEKPL